MRKLHKYLKKTVSGDLTDSFSEVLKKKYLAFQQLLANNDLALRLMADMEEKVSGEYLFDAEYIDANVRKIAYGVLHVIEHLNTLSSENIYNDLYKKFDVLNREIEDLLQWKFEVPVSDLTIPLEKITRDMVNSAGGKMTHLGAVKTGVKLPTPEGFAVSTYAFKKFMDHNRFHENTNRIISALSVSDLGELHEASRQIQETIVRSTVPDEVADAIRDAYSDLCRKTGKETPVAVRSSAIHEDGHFSFAGQYATFLNVPGDRILQKYKEVVASLFTPRAIYYYRTNGFSEEEMAMAVGILGMVDVKTGGVVYTRDPNNPSSGFMVINAVCGPGKFPKNGTVSPDSYIVSRDPQDPLPCRTITMPASGRKGALQEGRMTDQAAGKHCLTEKQIRTIAGYALAIEEYYGGSQDIEWALGKDGLFSILQARPLRMYYGGNTGSIGAPRQVKGYPVLLEKGVVVCKGIGFGKAFLLKDMEQLKHFPEGAVLVARHTDPHYVTVMHKASAIITEAGSATGHLASLTREYGVPAIFNTEGAMLRIKHGHEITVDAIHCNIYEGKVPELLEFVSGKRTPLNEMGLFKRLERVLKKIVPLTLADPGSLHFKPQHCETFHDITHFAHEKAMEEMSLIGEEHDLKGIRTVSLTAGIPVTIHLDIGGGIRPDIRKATPRDILSIPFSLMLRGMSSMQWPKPRFTEAGSFLGLLKQGPSTQAKHVSHASEKSCVFLSENYMHFSVRLGYHFSIIEAYVSGNMNDNYIKFSFQGGGSSLERRLRRVRLVKEILRKLGFTLYDEADAVDAVFAKYNQSTIEETLFILGKLTTYTKQLDAVLYNDAVTDMYIEQFINEHMGKASIGKNAQ